MNSQGPIDNSQKFTNYASGGMLIAVGLCWIVATAKIFFSKDEKPAAKPAEEKKTA